MSVRNLFELVFLAALWGLSFLLLRIATPEFGAVFLVQLRVVIASLFLLPIWFLKEANKEAKTLGPNFWRLVVIGCLNSALPFVLFSYSTLYITGGFSSILNSTAPVWGALVAWLWLNNRPSLTAWFGLALGVMGVFVLVSGSISLSLSGAGIGIVAALLAAFLYGIAANYTAEKLAQVSPLSIATFSQIAASVALIPFSIYYFPSLQNISMLAWMSVIALGVFCTGLAYTLYFRLIANVGSTKAITVTFLIPAFGMFWGAVFIDEQVTLEMLIGTSIILIGTALVTGVIKLPHQSSKDD